MLRTCRPRPRVGARDKGSWIEYPATTESLRKEKFLFLAQTEPYDKDDVCDLLVQRVEALLSKENTDWAQSMIKPPKGKKACLRFRNRASELCFTYALMFQE
jgi:hypothetical protein